MTLTRVIRVWRDQWWVIVLVALLGAGVALGAAELRNRGLEPTFEAVAPLTVLRLPEEPDDRFDRRVSTVVSQARSSVSERLADSNLRVEEGEAGGVVHFVATAPDSDAALSAATDLRRIYLDSRPAGTAEAQLNPVLDSLIAEIEVVEQELAELRGTPTSDQVTEAQRSALLSRMGSAVEESASLEARLLDPDLTDEERIEAEERLESLEALIDTLGARLGELPQTENTSVDSENRLEILVLERRLQELESQYVASALRQTEAGPEGLVGEPYVTDQSPTPISLSLAAFVGLLAGGLVSAVGVVGSDRLRQPIRVAEDVSRLPVIEIERRHPRSDRSIDWYMHSGDHPRRANIQALRSTLDRFPGKSRVVVTGVEDVAADLQQLATDLAVSISVTGRKVLIVDTNFGPSTVEGSGATLADILFAQQRAIPDATLIKRLLDERNETVPNLLIVAAGEISTDPIDALAGPVFKRIVAEASELVDIVIVSSPAIGTPGGDAAAVHSQLAVVGAARNRTHRDQLFDATGHLADLGITVSAIALLNGGSPLVPRSRSRGRRVANARSKRQRGTRRRP